MNRQPSPLAAQQAINAEQLGSVLELTINFAKAMPLPKLTDNVTSVC